MALHNPVSSHCSASLLLVSSLALKLSSLSILIMTLDFSVEIIFSPTFNVALPCQYLVFFRKIHLQFVNLNIISKVEGNIIIGDSQLTSHLQFISCPHIKLNNKCIYYFLFCGLIKDCLLYISVIFLTPSEGRFIKNGLS